jgi:hypothetical protein
MIRTFLAGITCLALLSSAARAEEKVRLVRDVPGPGPNVKAPNGPAPVFFIVTGLEKDQVELAKIGPGQDHITKYRPAFKGLDISDASGKTLSAENFAERVKIGTVVVASSDGKKVDPAYLNVLKGDTVILEGELAKARVSLEPTKDEKDEIKYEMDDLEKNFGIKFKAAKLEQKKSGGDTQITIILEFTKDVPDALGLGGGNDMPTLRKLFAGQPGRLSPNSLRCYFFDEDGVVFTKQPPGKIDGAVSGKDGDAFRITQSVPADVLAKTKKISFREEPFKK